MRIKERVQAVINSKDRINSGDSTTNFTFSFNRDISRIKEIELRTIQIPFSFYVINANNNVLTFNSGADTITMTPGNYTASSLASEIQTKMDAVFVGENSTVTYSTATYKFTIAKDVAFVVDSVEDVAQSTLAGYIGFKVSSASSTSATADSAVNISGPNYLLLASEYLTKKISTKTVYLSNTYENTLMVVPIDVNPGGIISYEPKISVILGNKITIKKDDVIDVQILDEDGNIIDINGLDISIHMLFITE